MNSYSEYPWKLCLMNIQLFNIISINTKARDFLWGFIVLLCKNEFVFRKSLKAAQDKYSTKMQSTKSHKYQSLWNDFCSINEIWTTNIIVPRWTWIELLQRCQKIHLCVVQVSCFLVCWCCSPKVGGKSHMLQFWLVWSSRSFRQMWGAGSPWLQFDLHLHLNLLLLALLDPGHLYQTLLQVMMKKMKKLAIDIKLSHVCFILTFWAPIAFTNTVIQCWFSAPTFKLQGSPSQWYLTCFPWGQLRRRVDRVHLLTSVPPT